MPVYGQAYRSWEIRGDLSAQRFWPITREGLRLLLNRKAFLGLLVLCWIPAVVRTVQIVVITQFPQLNRVLPVDGRLFGQFLNQQLIPCLLLTTFGGAGLIANDLRSGAILVYLSRALTRRDYVLGKLSVLVALNLSITLVPGVVLYLLALALSPAQFLHWSLWWVLPAIVLDSLLLTVAVSLLALALSSLTRSAAAAGLSFFGLVVVLDGALSVLRVFLSTPALSLLSLRFDLEAFAVALFGLRDASSLPFLLPTVVVLVFCGACILILRARVRAVEVVS